MNAVATKLKTIVNSSNLQAYKLTKQQEALLRKFDDVCRYMDAVHKKPPCVRLSRVDYIEIDRRVRERSDGQRDLTKLRYNGFPILSAAE